MRHLGREAGESGAVFALKRQRSLWVARSTTVRCLWHRWGSQLLCMRVARSSASEIAWNVTGTSTAVSSSRFYLATSVFYAKSIGQAGECCKEWAGRSDELYRADLDRFVCIGGIL